MAFIISNIQALPARGDYKAAIIVDGLQRSEVKRFASDLRQLGIHVRKVRGIRDEIDALARFADNICSYSTCSPLRNQKLWVSGSFVAWSVLALSICSRVSPVDHCRFAPRRSAPCR